MKRARVRTATVVAALAALHAMLSGRALADTFQVTKTFDSRDGACDADCSLREAIIVANARPGPDTTLSFKQEMKIMRDFFETIDRARVAQQAGDTTAHAPRRGARPRRPAKGDA